MQGGRAGASNPILSEDMMKLRLGKKMRRKARKAEAEASGDFGGDLGADRWLMMQQSGDKGAPLMMTNWKNNPNERRGVRSNRRG